MIAINGNVWCAKCGNPVEKMDSQFNPFTGDYLFTARCHGKTEQTILTRNEIANALSIDCTVAFKE